MSEFLKNFRFERAVKRLRELWEERRAEEIAWMEAAYRQPSGGEGEAIISPEDHAE